mmetsp:Transcript_6913/g.15782  ORF Transcript_6913/g.15782 Transcript_6913/m.15782 type:complete len:988 (+) Transcript_6913:60-3023(+)
MSKRNWCDTCRGDGSKYDELLRCTSCPRRFHKECAGLRTTPGTGWACPHCVAEEEDRGSNNRKGMTTVKKRIAAVRKCHRELTACSASFLNDQREHLRPFVDEKWFDGKSKLSLPEGGRSDSRPSIAIGPSPPFVKATLRSYQVAGVNFLLDRYNLGTGCIVADEMGLGKTIQSLSFIAALKDAGHPGPHLVVTPLAVLQNWANEIKRFTPGLTHIKIHGGVQERDRLMSRDDVVGGDFDVYLTTYDTFLSEEAFFTESFLFHTVIIDEGHRLKNVSCKLCKGLARLNSPFRVLLTGTPLQNCLAELIALLQYVLPSVPLREDLLSDAPENRGLNRQLVSQARDLLETCMIRRIKSQVEASLLPKIEYVLKPPLTRIQRKWYRSFLESDGTAAVGMLTQTQLMQKVLQCGKVANHPKTLMITFDRERKKNADMAKRAQGSMFVKVDRGDAPRTAEAIAGEAELRGLVGESLVGSCGKLALLDRLMLAKKKAGSRVLVFSQFTMTLDVLEEYVKFRFGPMGAAYLRLDGTTGRIQREMDMRSFNKPGCDIFCYLISTRAGGQGINLATADIVVLYDTCWNPQVDLQAQDRAHRIGQKKQVVVYRLISSNTVEERVLARARQKMVLDALVIKQRGSGDGLADLLADDGAEGDEEMAKLSVDELWNMLSEGAATVFNPAVDEAEDYGATEYDRLISEAEPAKWDDRTGVKSGDDGPSVKGSELDGTIFSKRKRGRPKKDETIDLVSYGDESVSSVPAATESSCSDSSPPDSPKSSHFDPIATDAVSSEVAGPRRGKRTRVAPTKFEANVFDSSQKKKKPRIFHDLDCFCCRKKVKKTELLSNPLQRSCNSKTPTRVDPDAPLECIACPRVYHMECSGERTRPKTRAWYCPWHACVTCERKKTQAGGTLFHCMYCPLTYCFDCAPDEHTEGGQSTSPAALALTAQLERKNMAGLKSFMFFTCGDCKARRDSYCSQQDLDVHLHAKSTVGFI